MVTFKIHKTLNKMLRRISVVVYDAVFQKALISKVKSCYWFSWTHVFTSWDKIFKIILHIATVKTKQNSNATISITLRLKNNFILFTINNKSSS